MRIAIDAGHGPETAGKRTPDGTLREFHFNSKVAAYARSGFEKYEAVDISSYMPKTEAGTYRLRSVQTRQMHGERVSIFLFMPMRTETAGIRQKESRRMCIPARQRVP